MKTTAKTILYTILLGAFPLWSQGTYTAASCSRSDVNAVINGPTHTAVDGDVIQIPSGSCTWTSGITVPSGIGISIIGSGTPNSGASTTGAASSCSATAITDNITGSSTPAFLFQPTYGSSLSQLSCMKILGSGGTNSLYSPVAVQGTCSSSTCSNLRIDNVTFDGSLQTLISNSGTVIVTDNVFGVMDHNTMSAVGVGVPGVEFVNVNNSAWAGTGAYGDNSWASADSFGTVKTLYLENNSWGAGVVIGEAESAVPNRGQGGGRIAARFNTCNGCLAGLSGHGTESNGRARGIRQLEFYGNTFVCGHTSSGCQGAVPIRSGVAYTFGNSLTVSAGAWFNAYMSFATYRTLQAFSPWGVCDGTGPYDNNDGTIYASGTVTSVSTGSVTATITDTTKTWTTNQWIPNGGPYAIHDVTTGAGAQITGNTSNTVNAGGWTRPPNFNAGDSYQILRSSACLDQANHSGGTLLSGSKPSPTGAINQTLDPSYEWDDFGYNPAFGNVVAGFGAQMIANRDWYTDNSAGTPHAQTSPTSPFNGTSGVGFGTLVNRPTTCTPRVGYFATDQGSWNQSSNGFGQGELFVCTSSNTWTLYYTPYTYPHPLATSGGTAGVKPPTNFQAVPR